MTFPAPPPLFYDRSYATGLTCLTVFFLLFFFLFFFFFGVVVSGQSADVSRQFHVMIVIVVVVVEIEFLDG